MMRSAILIGADHPSFAGHFPGFPVVPGAVLLDEALRAIAGARGIDLTQWRISSAKFLDVVRPRDGLVLEHEVPRAGLIRFAIHAENRKVASGTLSSAPHLEEGAPKPAEWVRRRERGSIALLKIMAFLSLRCGRRLSRIVLYGIAAYFFAFAPRARTHSRRYLRLALGRAPTARDRFRQILSFATTIHDRVYLINGQFEKFAITLEAEEMLRVQALSGRGALLLGAHMGSFEVVHSLSRRQPGLHVAMAMYEDNAGKIGGILAAVNPDSVHDIVSLGKIDAMLNIAQRLAGGAFVGVLSDRTLGEESLQAVTLLGQRAYLPTGPMRAAAILRCPVFFMAGLYRGKNKYHVVFERIGDFSQTPAASRNLLVRAAIDRYAAALEQCCRSDPYNWFNFYDFWASPGIRSE